MVEAKAKTFKVKKNLTLPQLKVDKKGVVVHVLFGEKIFQGKKIENSKKEPPMLANVTNLETGELCQIIIPAMVMSIMTDDYPDDGYVGKAFRIERTADPDGEKIKYAKYSVAELEV